MSLVSAYTPDEHRERYAAWAAFRAIAIRAKGVHLDLVYEVMTGAHVERALASKTFSSRGDFDKWHVGMVNTILRVASKRNLPIRFGQAAKLLAIHIKTLHIIPAKRKDLLRYAQPPIDRAILQRGLPSPSRRDQSKLRWTTFDQRQYIEIYKALEANSIDSSDPRWKMEALWSAPFKGSQREQ